jgi:hypothetical protein
MSGEAAGEPKEAVAVAEVLSTLLLRWDRFAVNQLSGSTSGYTSSIDDERSLLAANIGFGQKLLARVVAEAEAAAGSVEAVVVRVLLIGMTRPGNDGDSSPQSRVAALASGLKSLKLELNDEDGE